VPERLIECVMALVITAIAVPGVIWWLKTIAAIVWGPLP